MSTIPEIIRANAKSCAGEPFITIYSEGVYEDHSYGSVYERARQFQGAIKPYLDSPDTVIAIMLEQGVDLIAAFWGAMLCGAIPTILPPKSSKQDQNVFWSSHKTLFERINPALLVSTGDTYEEMARHIPGGRTAHVDPEATMPIASQEELAVSADLPAFLQHSSGTTGVKKGVILSHQAVIDQVASYAEAINLAPRRDRIATWLPLYHDMGLIAAMIMPTITATPIVMMSPFEWVGRPTSLLDIISERKCTLTWLPNFAFQHIANAVRKGQTWDLASMRGFMNCSEPCKPAAFDKFLTALPNLPRSALQVCYALAENTFAATQTTIGEEVKTFVADASALQEGKAQRASATAPGVALLSCGKALKGAEVRIVDAARQAVEDGRIGEIALQGRFIAGGYFALPEATSSKFVHGWYYTGDLGFLDSGELYVTGRTDDLLIVKGKNMYAHDLEQTISGLERAIPGRNVVLGLYDEKVGSSELIVMVEPTSDEEQSHKLLRKDIRETIFNDVGVYPKKVVLVPAGWLIKSTSGKISRSGNLEKYRREYGDIL